jgi:hypothetical protein
LWLLSKGSYPDGNTEAISEERQKEGNYGDMMKSGYYPFQIGDFKCFSVSGRTKMQP